MKGQKFFKNSKYPLSDRDYIELTQGLYYKEYKENQTIYSYNDDANNFYMIAKGRVSR